MSLVNLRQADREAVHLRILLGSRRISRNIALLGGRREVSSLLLVVLAFSVLASVLALVVREVTLVSAALAAISVLVALAVVVVGVPLHVVSSLGTAAAVLNLTASSSVVAVVGLVAVAMTLLVTGRMAQELRLQIVQA